MRDGHLHALAVTASSYGSGLHVTFYDALDDIVPWTRSQRLAVRAEITDRRTCSRRRRSRSSSRRSRSTSTAAHEYCGDGSMRQAAPISPAVHLGAERILVVGAGRMHEPPGERVAQQRLPEPRADRRPCAVEHLPRRARRRRRAAAADQRDAGAAAAAGARRDQPEADRGAGDRAERAPRRHRRQAPGEPAAADPRDAARHGRLRPGRRRARRGAGELPALRGALHARADRARRARHAGAARRGARLLRLGRGRGRGARQAARRPAARRCRPVRRGRASRPLLRRRRGAGVRLLLVPVGRSCRRPWPRRPRSDR